MELLFFFKPGCPYCRQAERILAELIAAEPRFGGIKIRRIDETRETSLADSYNYWYVPSFFKGGVKLYEADPARSEDEVRTLLRAMLEKAL